MSNTRVKISSIVENQLPEFIREEFPLVKEFFSQYYNGVEYQGGPFDILQNIDKYVKVEELTNLKQSVTLTSDIEFFDTTIAVDSTDGFPQKYGLLQIGNEIITYQDKSDTEFLECSRGFSGITTYKSNNNPEELLFSPSESSSHLEGSVVKNLSVLFLNEFLTKIKKQFSPGFESRTLDPSLNQNIFIKQSKDFYSSKGTDNSFKILFRSLYNQNVEIIKPREYMLRPSDARYRVTRDLVVEVLEGDPLSLINKTLRQDESEYSNNAFGSIAQVEKFTKDLREYYYIRLDFEYNKDIDLSGSIFGQFSIHPKTSVINVDSLPAGSSSIDVDSTVGFPSSGSLILKGKVYLDGNLESIFEQKITYGKKTLTQFLECTNVPEIFDTNEYEVRIDDYAYGINDDGETVRVRISGSVEDLELNDRTYLYSTGDSIINYTLGEQREGNKENDWIFNTAVTYEISSITQNSTDPAYLIVTKNRNSISRFDNVNLNSVTGTKVSARVTNVIDEFTFIISEQGSIDTTIYNSVTKKLSKVDSANRLVANQYNANIQNVYFGGDDVYVASPSLPKYQERLDIRDFKISFSGIFTNLEEIDLGFVHPLYTGDSVYYSGVDGSNRLNILDGVYFVKKVDDRRIKLARSRSNIDNNFFVSVSGSISNNTLELFDFVNQEISPQNIIRKISNPINDSEEHKTLSGPIGILKNGVEVLNYKSKDFVYYGPIEEIEVTSQGSGYDVTNPPVLTISDKVGTGATAFVSVLGSLKEVQIIDPGFDYIQEPVIRLTGGNGSGSIISSNLVSVDHTVIFNSTGFSTSVDIINSIIGFTTYHKFRHGEKVIYETFNQPAVAGLVTGSSYYVSVESLTEIRLYKEKNDAIAKSSTYIGFGTVYGVGNHAIKAFSKKKILSSVNVENEGSGYASRPTFINTNDTKSQNDVVFADDILLIKNHGYSSGEIIVYSNDGSHIGGLAATSYYVTKIDSDRFRLSQVAIGSTNSDFYYQTKQYVKLTSKGSGIHSFNYEPISITVSGILGFTTSPNGEYQAILQPKVRGEIVSANMYSSGNAYGSNDIINFNRQPTFSLFSGNSATLIPIISDGRITEVLVNSSGFNYNSPPELLIEGDGSGAVLTPVVENGSITKVIVVSKGFNYTTEKTFITVIPAGNNARFSAKIKTWTIDLFERLFESKQLPLDDGIITNGINSNYGLEYSHLYASRSLRRILKATTIGEDGEIITRPDIDSDVETSTQYHSPIIGWAYDGNPIYGPYGYSSKTGGTVRRMKSSYILNLSPDRPSGFSNRFFVEDYTYIGQLGDEYLDEHNGRYCVTPEYPNGVYAYFATISDGSLETDGVFRNQRKPEFPYLIGDSFKSKPDQFNFDPSSNQDQIDLNETSWSRNTKPYSLTEDNSSYDFIVNPTKTPFENATVGSISRGKIQSIKVLASGDNYQVGDRVVFDNTSTSGNNVSARISKVDGRLISTVSVASSTIQNVEFVPYGAENEFVAICTSQHNYLNNTPVLISGLSTSIVNLSGFYNIKVKNTTFNLAKDLQDVSISGIVTTVEVTGDLSSPNILENDVLGIGTEKVLIRKINPVRSEITIQREYDNTIGVAHSQFSTFTEIPRKFYITAGVNTSLNYRRNVEVYFDPETSVGLGTTSGVGITSTIFVSSLSYGTPVSIANSSQTTLIFNNPAEISQYFSGGYVSIDNSTTSVGVASTVFHVSKAKIVAVGNTSITIDFDSDGLISTGVTAFVDKLLTVEIPTKSIYIPNHGLETGDEVTYSKVGAAISVSLDGYSDVQALSDFSSLFVLKFNNNILGLATSRVGLGSTGTVVGLSTLVSTSTLYFNGIGTTRTHSLKTNYSNVISGLVETNRVTVSTSSTHGLKSFDNVDLNILSGISTTNVIEYDSTNRRIVVNPVSFNSGDVDTASDSISINNHGFYNGQKVVYTATSAIGGLSINSIYFINILDKNTIRLSTSLYNATKKIPETVNLTSTSSGRLLPINPEIKIYKNQPVSFDLSSPTLSFAGVSAFSFDIFSDSAFRHVFDSDEKNSSFEVTKLGRIGIDTNATVTLSINDFTPDQLHYNLRPINKLTNSPDNLGIIQDIEVLNANSIKIEKSSYSGLKTIIGVTTNNFSFFLNQLPESQSYTNNSNSICSYTTNSKSVYGPINEIEVQSGGYGYKSIPGISTIVSDFGSSALLVPISLEIGSILSTKIKDIGYDYSADKTIRPTSKLPQILKISPLSEFTRIGISSAGKYYTSAPTLVVIDGISGKKIEDVDLKYNIGDTEVSILKNTTTMRSVLPTIIPTKNSNSVRLTTLTYNAGNKTVTAGIAVSYSNAEDFPFSVGDKIIVENITIIPDTGTGYNSMNYDYKLFPIISTDPNIGGENGSIVYYMGDVLEGSNTPGTVDEFNSIPTALPEKFFPQFSIQIQKKNFFDKEIITSNDGKGGVSQKWDSRNDYLKVSTSDDFVIGSIISGASSKTNGVVEDVIKFNSKYSINSTSIIRSGFAKNTGFLNDDLQRISDNDYYQNFSYSLKSIVPLDRWDDAVQSLNHTSGFKKFSDLSLESKDPFSVGIITDQNGGSVDAINDIFGVVNLNCVSDFDLASELSVNINGELTSENVLFNSRILQDYSESVSNRVLLVDDISDQFEDRPRTENYSVLEEFELDSAISRKYITFVQDNRFIDKKQILLVSLLQNSRVGFINQYGRVFTSEDLGSFDYRVEEDKGQLLFYPINYSANDYSINLLSYNLGYFDVLNYSSSFDLGDTVQIKAAQLEFIAGITTSVVSISSTYRASKILVQIDAGSDLEFNEITLLHNGTDVSILEYGQILDEDTYISAGLGTFSASISGSNVVLDFNPNAGVSGTITSLRVSIANTSSVGVGTEKLRNSEFESNIVSIAATSSPGITTISSYVQENFEEKYSAAYFIVSIEDKTNSESEVVEILTIDDGTQAYITEFGNVSTSSGLGTFGVGIANSITNLHFTQNEDIDVEVRIFKHAIGPLNPPNPNGIISIDQGSLLVGSGNYIGTTNVNTTFTLYHKTNPIFEKSFVGSSSTIVSVENDNILIPNHYFVTGEEVEYVLPRNSEEEPIGIASTYFVGIGTTDKLPSTIYIIKDDDIFIRLASSAENALKLIPLAIDITSVGIGSRHKFISKDRNSRSLISIDNIIQSPVYETTIKTSLASTATVFVDTLNFVGVSSFAAGDIVKINNEIMKVQSISGTNVGVLRYRLGTELERHGLGSTVTKMKGNYNIVDNELTFDQTPYGERPLSDPSDPNAIDWSGITTHSTFSGRIFVRSGEPESINRAYYDNIIFDDISSNFNGITTSFILKSNGQNVSGVQTNNPILLIDSIFQNAQRIDTSIDIVGNYDIDETAGISTIMFLGQTGIQTTDINVSKIPYGGVLFGVGSTQGFGYQPLVAAGATIQVSASGTITSISIGQSGSGYRAGIQTVINVYARNAFSSTNPVSIGTADISNGNIVSIALTNTSPVGVAFTDYATYKTTQISYPVGSGSTVFYIFDTKDILVGDFISIGSTIINVPIVGVASTSIQVGSASTVLTSFSIGDDVLLKKFSTPIVIIDQPLTYNRIPLIYSSSSTSGVGSGAFIDIIVGQGSSVIDFTITNDGFGYKEGEILTIPVGGSVGIPTDTTKPFEEFQVFVDRTFNNEFSAWSLGVLQLIDDISPAFDGSRKKFTLRVDGKITSFTTRKGSSIDVQSNLLVFLNDILQVPGEGYTFNGGSVITFAEPPKGSDDTFGGDECKILFYKGTKDVDVIDIDILETIKEGDDITLESDDSSLGQDERLVTLVDSTSSVVTNAYSGPGVTSDLTLQRPVYWCRQTEDRVINGREVGKSRTIYEPIINPLTNIIQDVGLTTSYIYVSSLKPFFNSSKENLGSRFTNKIEIYDPQVSLIGAAASVTVSAAGTISNISIANSGRGYSSAPNVIIGEPHGIGRTQRATATASITLGFVTSITLTNVGSGYSSSGVSNVSVSRTFFGQGWPLIGTDTYDSIRFNTDIGSGFGAVADIKVINGVPTEVTIVNSGRNYQIGDVLSVSRIGDNLLSVPAQFFVTDIENPIVFIEPPDIDNREIIDNVTFEGDYGIITGVATTSVGVASTGLVFDLFIPENSVIRDGNINTGIGTTGVSGIQTGFYFTVINSNIGSGVTSYRLDSSVIGIGTSCLDNVYQVVDIEYATRDAIGVGSTELLRVTVSVSDNNIAGLGSSDFFGEFSWGRVYTPTRRNPKEYTSNSISGIDTSPVIRRFNSLKYELYRL
jgi:hypothetical protein